MSGPPPILLVSHRGLGEGLVVAAESILGERPPVDLLDNHGIAPAELESRIASWLDAHPGPVLVLTDLEFGSCCQAARRMARGREDVGIVTGVSLPILLAALRSREHGDAEERLRHVGERGRAGIEVYRGGDPV